MNFLFQDLSYKSFLECNRVINWLESKLSLILFTIETKIPTCEYTVVDDFRFKFRFIPSMDTHKHGNKEKLSTKKASL